MKSIQTLLAAFIIGLLPYIVLGQNPAQESPQLGKASVNEVVAAMTLDEKVSLVVGAGMPGVDGNSAVVGLTHEVIAGAAGNTTAIPRLGIPSIVMADGPAGLRISPTREGTDKTFYCTAFPVATALSSSWNADLMERVGEAFGNEAQEYGIDVLLAPGMNIQRNPLCGRNFEYYSEDPLLSGRMAAAFVRGIQSNGVGASLKHFAANNQETNRMYVDIRLSERALREIYLKGFEIAVKESSPYTIMSSYNRINGTFSSHNKELLTNVLRNEWGYTGLVLTDWFGGKDGAQMVAAGNDLIMPGTDRYKQQIIKSIEKGQIKAEDLDSAVCRILELIVKSPHFRKYEYSEAPDLKAHADLVREAGSESMVLLENNGVLPLIDSVKRIAAYGVGTYDYIIGGTGSGDVNEAYAVSLANGLVNAGYQLYAELKDTYIRHIEEYYIHNKLDPNDKLASYLPKPRPVEIIPEATQLALQAKANDIAVITISRCSGEFLDRKIKDDFELTDMEKNLIKSVTNAYHARGKKAIVVLNIGGVIETTSWKFVPDAILLAWQGGQEAGNSIADVISGRAIPSGKLPMTFPICFADVASSANFPTDYTPSNQMELAMGRSNVKPEKQIRNVDYTLYEEDIYVGYRYFDSFDKSVSYPFGYGLSYTQFGYESASVSGSDGNYIVCCTIKNTGSVSGKEVVQLYVAAPGKSMNKPVKELKAFAKTKLLQPGETQTILLKLTPDALASFDETNNQWVIEPGDYTGQIGASSDDIRQSVNFSVAKEIIVEKTHNVVNPEEAINKLR
jgi:beta-glucosidase